MKTWYVEFGGQSAAIQYEDNSVADLLEFLFVDLPAASAVTQVETFRIVADPSWKHCELRWSDGHSTRVNSRCELALQVVSEVLFTLINKCSTGHIIHAAAVHKDNMGILMPGKSGAGKSTLCAWFVKNGYTYLTDEAICFPTGQSRFHSFTRPIHFKPGSISALDTLSNGRDIDDQSETDGRIKIVPHRSLNANWKSAVPDVCLLLFPEYATDHDFSLEPLKSAQASMALMGVHANARNLEHHGFHEITNIARSTPAFRLVYSDYTQLENRLDLLVELVMERSADATHLVELFRSMQTHGVIDIHSKKETTEKVTHSIPEPTKSGSKKKLCLGMATYDDYDGVYFSVQAIRMFHPEITQDTEILVIDNNPTGACSPALKKLDSSIKGYRYVPNANVQGTAIRDLVFQHANADYVLCMDSHVLLEPNAIRQFIDYLDQHLKCMDLLQGPMLYDDQSTVMTHFEPQWRAGMYGIWAYDERGRDKDNPPFEIPMQGLGLFGCRRQAWLGFNKHFRGFGGEEGYIHEKFRQAGRRTLCLPFLRWLHRFERPNGVPYRLKWEDRIHNYWVGFNELRMDTAPMIEHFRSHLGKRVTDNILADIQVTLREKTVSPSNIGSI